MREDVICMNTHFDERKIFPFLCHLRHLSFNIDTALFCFTSLQVTRNEISSVSLFCLLCEIESEEIEKSN